MSSVAYYAAGLIAITATLAKLLIARKRSPGLRYLCGALLCLGLSAAMLAPDTLQLGARIEPTPNLTRLVGNGLSAGAVFCMVGVLAYAAHAAEPARRRMRIHNYVFVSTLVAMAVLLVSARTRFTVDFVNVYATHPIVAAYEVVFLAYATWGMVGVVLLMQRVVNHATNAFLRAGLWVVAVGTSFGIGWSLCKITITLIKATTKRPIPIEGEVSTFLSAAAILLIALGATMTAWAPRAVHPLVWLRARWTYRRIEPLWAALHAATPDLELQRPDAGIKFRLYRRIVEIRDSSLALRVHFHPDVPAWAEQAARTAGITSETSIAAVAEAASLAGALEAHRVGHRYHADGSTAPTPFDVDPDISAEARWLVRVADAFTRSPVVEAVRQRVRAELCVSDRESPAV
jgi:hypothetical protein